MHAVEDFSETPKTQPRIWLVLGDKAGDNGQVFAVAEALGWSCQHKRIQMREPYVIGKPKVAASLYHIDPARSDPLEPPWPDLIVTIGRRPSMVALWIREQSGGHTKIVLLGKPSGLLVDSFDLVIVSGEIQLPERSNVVPITLPLMQVNQTEIAAAAATWQPRLATLPRPLIAILIGGPTGNLIFDNSVVEDLIEVATEIAVEQGGMPYIATSRRTPASIVEALKTKLPAAAQLFQWTPDSADNPYRGLLGLADGFVVTGDSISMMVEVVRLRKPLAIFPLPLGRLGAIDQLRRSLARWLFAPATDSGKDRLRQRLANAVYHTRLITHTRDFIAFHQLLIDRGLAVQLGESLQPPSGQVPNDLSLVVSRIRALVDR